MHLRIATASFFLVFCAFVAPALADKRVALVIGNGAYEVADKLTNPTIDSRAMRSALEKLGFTVVYGENLSKRDTERTIGRFSTAANGADVAIAYYAGHGATFDGRPYIVPVDARFEALNQMRYELVPLEDMIGELRNARGVRVAIVDACRDNSKEEALKRVPGLRGVGDGGRGLGRVNTPDGLIVAYATAYNTTAADGTAGKNSPFTAALLQNLPTPGLDIKDVFFRTSAQVVKETDRRQRPEIAVSMYESFSLVPVAASSPVSSLPGAVASIPTEPVQAVDAAFLEMIASASDRTMLERLSGSQTSAVSAAAKTRLSALSVPNEPVSEWKKVIDQNTQALFRSANDAVIGNPTGAITLVEFFDYNDGYSKIAAPNVSRLVKEFPELRVVLKSFPVLGSPSREAAKIAAAARKQLNDAQFAEFHRKLLATRGIVGRPVAMTVAKTIGSDTKRLDQDMNSAEVAKAIDETMEIAERLSLNATPSWVLGDEVIMGAVGYNVLREKIGNMTKCGKVLCR